MCLVAFISDKIFAKSKDPLFFWSVAEALQVCFDLCAFAFVCQVLAGVPVVVCFMEGLFVVLFSR